MVVVVFLDQSYHDTYVSTNRFAIDEIYYWCDAVRGKQSSETDVGSYHPLWQVVIYNERTPHSFITYMLSVFGYPDRDGKSILPKPTRDEFFKLLSKYPNEFSCD